MFLCHLDYFSWFTTLFQMAGSFITVPSVGSQYIWIVLSSTVYGNLVFLLLFIKCHFLFYETLTLFGKLIFQSILVSVSSKTNNILCEFFNQLQYVFDKKIKVTDWQLLIKWDQSILNKYLPRPRNLFSINYSSLCIYCQEKAATLIR